MSARSARASQLVVGGEPRVDLLPPEVAQRKKARRARRGLVALVVVVLLAVAGGYVFATYRAVAAQFELAAAQARTTDLLVEQQKYSEVTTVSGQLAAVENARTVGVSTEVLWNDVYKQIRDRLPEGVTIGSFLADGRSPWEPEFTPAGPLRQPRVATLVFVLVSPDSPFAIEPFVKRIAEIKGFADVSPDVLQREDPNFETTFTYNLSTEALSGRFAADDAGGSN